LDFIKALRIVRLDEYIEDQIGAGIQKYVELITASKNAVKDAKGDVEALVDCTLNNEKLLNENQEIERWLQKNPSPYSRE
jgi:hypothetical protein